MIMAIKVGKIFGLFDKIDDIIYEPVKLICDILRQPLNQIDCYNDKKRAEHEQQLQMQIKQFEMDLELERKEREMRLTVEEQEIQEEINDMVRSNDLAKREEMVQLEMKYRKEMAAAAVQLANVISDMQADTRKRIFNLYTEKEKEYFDLQEAYKKEMLCTVKNLKGIFPDGTGDELIQEEVKTQLRAIAERSTEFSRFMRDDMAKVFGIIDDSMKEVTGLAAKYFQPVQPKQNALTQNVVDVIEG